MCGIFGYVGKEPLQLADALRVLRLLESDQLPSESSPVGGDGAGIAFLQDTNECFVEKVGAASSSPADSLTRLLQTREDAPSVIIGHVRRATSQFRETIRHRECAQPYKVACQSDFTIVSAHNGYVENYLEIREKLKLNHFFESEGLSLIDSEVIPHAFEELLLQSRSAENACAQLFKLMNGNNAVVILTLRKGEGEDKLHIIHKGTSRGLNIWTNTQKEIVICSREKPVQNVLNDVLANRGFQKTVSVRPREPANLSRTFYLTLSHNSTT